MSSKIEIRHGLPQVSRIAEHERVAAGLVRGINSQAKTLSLKYDGVSRVQVKDELTKTAESRIRNLRSDVSTVPQLRPDTSNRVDTSDRTQLTDAEVDAAFDKIVAGLDEGDKKPARAVEVFRRKRRKDKALVRQIAGELNQTFTARSNEVTQPQLEDEQAEAAGIEATRQQLNAIRRAARSEALQGRRWRDLVIPTHRRQVNEASRAKTVEFIEDFKQVDSQAEAVEHELFSQIHQIRDEVNEAALTWTPKDVARMRRVAEKTDGRTDEEIAFFKGETDIDLEKQGRFKKIRKTAVTYAGLFGLAEAVNIGTGIAVDVANRLSPVHIDTKVALAALGLSYVGWFASLKKVGVESWQRLKEYGSSFNLPSFALYETARALYPEKTGLQKAAAVTGVLLPELAMEIPYYLGAYGSKVATKLLSSSLLLLATANGTATLLNKGIVKISESSREVGVVTPEAQSAYHNELISTLASSGHLSPSPSDPGHHDHSAHPWPQAA